MASYQDLESRLGVVERKIAFLFSLTSITKREPSLLAPSGYVEKKMSMDQLYRELSNENAVIAPEQDDVNG